MIRQQRFETGARPQTPRSRPKVFGLGRSISRAPPAGAVGGEDGAEAVEGGGVAEAGLHADLDEVEGVGDDDVADASDAFLRHAFDRSCMVFV